MDRDAYRQSVSIVVWRDGKILAVNNRRWGGFSCPGGKVDGTESLEDAAKRELLEETGCNALRIKHLDGRPHTSLPRDANKKQWWCTAFEADIGDQEPKAAEPGTEPFWTTPQELIKNGLYDDWYVWLFKEIFQMKV